MRTSRRRCFRELQGLIPPGADLEKLHSISPSPSLPAAQDGALDRICQLTFRVFKVRTMESCMKRSCSDPMCVAQPQAVAISFVEANQCCIKSFVGADEFWAPLACAMRSFPILDSTCLVVSDAGQLAPVEGSTVLRFYAAAAIMCAGMKVGTLCLGACDPRYDFDESQQAKLRGLADLIGEIILDRRMTLLTQELDQAKLIVGALYHLHPTLQTLIALKEKIGQSLADKEDSSSLAQALLLFEEKLGHLEIQIELSLLASYCPLHAVTERTNCCRETDSQALVDRLKRLTQEQEERRLVVDSSLSYRDVFSYDSIAFSLIAQVVLSLWTEYPRYSGMNQSVTIFLSLSEEGRNHAHCLHDCKLLVNFLFAGLRSKTNTPQDLLCSEREPSYDEAIMSQCSVLLCQQLVKSYHGEFHHVYDEALEERHCSFWVPCRSRSLTVNTGIVARERKDISSFHITDSNDDCTVAYTDMMRSDQTSFSRYHALEMSASGTVDSCRQSLTSNNKNSFELDQYFMPSVILRPIIPNIRSPTSITVPVPIHQLPHQTFPSLIDGSVVEEKVKKKARKQPPYRQSYLYYLCKRTFCYLSNDSTFSSPAHSEEN